MAITLLHAPTSPDRVVPIGGMREARASHTMTTLPDGRVLITGGFAGSGGESETFRTTELFDPATERFSAGPSMHAGRTGHTATLLADGRVLIAGGWPRSGESWGSVDLFDPVRNTMVGAMSMLVPRAGHTATRLPDGRVLITGGVDRSTTELASAELFDPATGRFTRTGDMMVRRAAHTATLLADGRVLVTGGGMGRYPNASIHRAAEIFDPATGRFAQAGELAVARHKHAAIALKDGRVLIVGGSDNRDWSGQYDDAEVYDPATRRSSVVARMAGRRFKLSESLVLLDDGGVLVAGGGDKAEVFDAATRTFARVGDLRAASYYSATALLKSGKVLITGGYSRTRGGLPASNAAFVFQR